MTNEYRSLVLAAGENYRLVPFDVSFTEALFEAVQESRNELIRFVSWTRGKRATGGRRSTSPHSFHSLRHTAVSLLKDGGVPQADQRWKVGFKVFQDEEILTAIEGTTPEHQLHEFLEYHFPRRQPATLEKN